MPILVADAAPRFDLGHTCLSDGARALLTLDVVRFAFMRHVSGDWGEMKSADRTVNEMALGYEGRLVSIYRSREGKPFYVITDAGWTMTTILLPSEY